MATREAPFSREEFARKGQDIYERDVLPIIQASDQDKFVAIDINSGRFEIDPDDYTATERLLDMVPDAQMWLVRVGQPAAHRLGARSAPGSLDDSWDCQFSA
jgi:hypothetical protein